MGKRVSKKIKVAIVGASGYTGLELIKIISSHPKFEISYIGASKDDGDISLTHPSLEGVVRGEIVKSDAKKISKVASLAFLALPHKASMSFAKELLKLGVKVVDLSADYRLSKELYEEYYCPHEDEANLKNAVYGLPEIYENKIKDANLVANPGCYPTASLLAIIPFLKYIKKDTPIMIDAKSGVSGAGKKLSETTHFVNINENIFAYNPFAHRHAPEIKEQIELIGGVKNRVFFVPHLVPIIRGMLVSVYLELDEKIDPLEVLRQFYKNEPFVRIRNKPVDVKLNAGTNFCDIYAKFEDGVLFVSSAIDNLLKGASSQAVANANLMFGYDKNLGLPSFSYVP